ncbi:hypothetical protein EDD18DRAFT_406899 [Armillaria luteobubalina]|uniref:TPR-like protein n=1 Tax=Armillaria luteobubalina TaxID=153913 RepID=A0AA39PZX8_9AGAR|nr:hypothetical protein EDD18DRAFT_406899 [Armillaria luteobubalina]
MEILEAVIQYRDVSMGRLVLECSALKAEATSCVGHIDMAVKVFQTKILIGTSIAVEQTRLTGEKILVTMQKGLAPSSSLNLDVLACPAPSQYFTGRESDLQKLSRMLGAPVVTLFSMNSHALSAFVHSFDSSRFTTIFLDAGSVEALKMIVHKTKTDDSAHQPTLLVLENADPSLELGRYLPYSLHTPILITSTNEAVSCFASAQDYRLELPDAVDQWVANSLYQSIERAFSSLLQVVTIVARGGTGKTQLVLRFVSENSLRFTNIWFFDATSDAMLTANFQKLGKAAGIGESVDDIQNFLRKMNEAWLLIFDNADDSKVDLSKYIPQCNHGNVIITSRLTEVHQMASPDSHFDFLDLEQNEAVNLLLKHAHQNTNNDNQQLALGIVNALGCQALAVATAGAYIASTATCTLSNYLSLFKQKSKQLLNYKMKSLEGYQNTVFSAFQLSFDQLNPSTQLFMQICSFFHHTTIPIELFHRASAFTGEDLLPEEKKQTTVVKKLKHFLSLFPNNEAWDDSINELSHLSLTMYDIDTKTLSFHSILQMCTQETFSDKSIKCQIAQLLLARATSYGISEADYQFQRLLIAHIDSIHQNDCFILFVYNSFGGTFFEAGLWIKAECIWQRAVIYCEKYLGKSHLNTLIFKNNLALSYHQQGLWEKAEMLDKETLELHKKLHGEHHPETLTSMNNFAQTYYQQGQWEKAEVLLKETLELRKELLGKHHPDTLKSMSNLAQVYHEQGQLEKAEVLGKEALSLQKELLGEHHPDTLKFMNNLALTYQQQGQLVKAEVLGKETLKLRKELLGEHHPNTLTSMNNRAMLYYQQGQKEEAEVLLKETLKLQKEVLGEHHPDIFRSMSNLAQVYHEQGQWEKAEMLGKETLKLWKELLGKYHPDTLNSMNNLAMSYYQQGQWKKAEVLGKELLNLQKELLGEHPDTLRSMNNLAMSYYRQEQWEKAEMLWKETLKLQKKILGEHHSDTLTCMDSLAQTYQQQGQWVKAEVLGKELLNLHKKLYGEHHPDTLKSMNNLAMSCYQQGQWKKAEVLGKEILNLQRELLGQHHPDTLKSMNNLAMSYYQQGQWKKTEVLGKEILNLQKELLGEHHPDTLTSMSNLAMSYYQQAQWEKAEILQKETLKLQKEMLGEHHPNTLRSMNNLAQGYHQQGQQEKAEMLYKKILKLQKETFKEHHPNTK